METFYIRSLDELPAVAEKIAEKLRSRPVAAFYGAMGAGKTTLIREIAAQLGVEDMVTSPTFALVNQYNNAVGDKIYHFDFYRIDRIEEAFDMGYEEYFYGGDICLIEWPEKVEELVPPDALRIKILTDEKSDNSRTIIIE